MASSAESPSPRRRLAAEPQRAAWYPGSKDRLADAKRRIPGLKQYGAAPQGASNGHAFTPWLFSDGLSPDQAGFVTTCLPC